jgi:hypothetical protein
LSFEIRGSVITASPIQLGAMMRIFVISVTVRRCAWDKAVVGAAIGTFGFASRSYIKKNTRV